ncbi:MAG TPA: hypothetical protein VFQ53_06375 [Kofleriaceae bacterium]|nr:hypothetical protein [Kofleriaceae bacterium]
MARGVARAPSQNAYRGALGKTQTATVHVTSPRGDLIATQVHTTIDAVSDPELVDRMYSEDPQRALNTVRFDGGEIVRVQVPVVYHDPAAELMVLVLGDAHRHQELEERIRVYERMLADDAAVPAYAKEFAVVYGAHGLRGYLERRAQEALDAARQQEARAEYDKRLRELEQREDELERKKSILISRVTDSERALAAQRAELARERAEIDQLRSEARNRVIAAVASPPPASDGNSEATTIGPPPEPETRPHPRVTVEPNPSEASEASEAEEVSASDVQEVSDVETSVQAALPPPPNVEAASHVNGKGKPIEVQVEFDEETTGSSIVPQGSDPLTTETLELDAPEPDPWLARALGNAASTFGIVDGRVRLALVVGEHIARGLGGMLDVRVVLHRVPTYPLIAFVIGPPAALRVPSPTQLALVTLDIAAEQERAVLAQLARRFELVLDICVRGKSVRHVRLVAPLHENVGFILRAAEDHLRAVTAEGEPSYAQARDLVAGAGFDVLGIEHPDHAEFRDDKLAQLETAQQLRRAIAMARRFARPSREDYLVCTRGFPLPRWRELRRHVLESAVAWGLWMGPELAQVAVSEGLARSRRDLIGKLDKGFETLRRHPTAYDIDDEAAADNAKALAEEAKALGVELPRAQTKNGAIASDEVSTVSGSIGVTPAHGIVRPPSTDDLIAQLDDRQQRLKAALELCDRAEARAAAPVIGAVSKMSRAEAVRVLGMSVKFGPAAKAPLLEGLASSKAFLRHGCALALALLRSDDGTQAVIELLMTEPTEIWREVARAIGQVGPTALLPLASTYGRLGERATPALSERVAWAMAHIAVRGGKAAVEAMAGGQSIVAPVAAQALKLHSSAANDQVRVRPGADGSQPGRDVTVNRAFSRRFFEALEQGIPDAGAAGLVDLDASGPMEMLDEADLIADDDEESELDESDLIQT